jgi:hypothetical protein
MPNTLNLDFDVARLLDELLDEDAVVTEAVARLVAAGGKALERFLVVVGHAQPLAAAAGTGLDHDRIADATRDLDRLLGRLDRVVPARDGVDTRFLGQFFGGDFVAHGGDGVVLRADEDQPFFLDAAGELLVFGQETVARVNGLGSRGLGRGNDFVGDQVALAAGGRPEQHGLVGQTDMAGFTIRLGVHRDGGDAHLTRGRDSCLRGR